MRPSEIEPRFLGLLDGGLLDGGWPDGGSLEGSSLSGLVPSAAPTIARVSSERLSKDAGPLRHAGLTHVLVELHGPSASAHAVVSRALSGGTLESFDDAVAAIGHARAHGLAVIVLSDVSRSGARVLRELGALLARLRVDAWCIHGPWTEPELVPPQLPRAVLTMPFVLDAAVRAQKDGIEVALIGMPLCLLGPHHPLAVRPSAVVDDRVHGAPCDRCDARAQCSGLGPGYRAVFGAGELRPIAAPISSRSPSIGRVIADALAAR